MDHDATREQLDLAAAEPGGLERLMAGDTATAQAVAAHLAGCDECSEELVRLQRSAALIRSAVRELPPDDLRARTLAAVRAQGVPRPLAVSREIGPENTNGEGDRASSRATPAPESAAVPRQTLFRIRRGIGHGRNQENPDDNCRQTGNRR